MTNALAGELSDGAFVPGANVATGLYLDPRRRAQPRWGETATAVAGWLRTSARDDDPRSVAVRTALMADPHFREVWERHDVGPMTGGTVEHRVAGVGPLPLELTVLEVSGSPGHLLFSYHAADGTPSAAALERARARTSAPAALARVSSGGPGAVVPGFLA
ncbi:hypothetical protein BJF88_07725 [Cellulosimicrobium sp. CUA-896]|nr:hypothetical protein BJF88_07725 [Cellulosimicrobium sp. CUA-896]